ncbi:protein kinase domain-containing protein [Leptospira interrogans]|uniref:protein kinase domain-containing protein n=1 Tax=Leptospira interrogans TaxID=173 RepID=UPI0002977B7C|nr:protein kinase [Leptospira interrogans]EKR15542.1 kinase domain protein [Leptospira interrogans serovar Pyrogenes str. 2006006960]
MDILKFTRQKDFQFVKRLGEGAFGQTILMKDQEIDQLFVCKKYSPFSENLIDEFYDNFKEEIKLLHLTFHENIVRIFNYHLYPKQKTGYIIMEFVEGETIDKYVQSHPEDASETFLQLVSAFQYLESYNILHRDIRPQNILVTNNGKLKLIDFGFGKKIHSIKDFDKSISLNWPCEPPNDFAENRYNFSTEIYFVGKIFEEIILNNNLNEFRFNHILSKMVKKNSNERYASFQDVYLEAFAENASESALFSEEEKEIYKNFAVSLTKIISKLTSQASYQTNIDYIIQSLSEVYKANLLEENIQDLSKLIGCFINGSYRYYTKEYVSNEIIKLFLDLLKRSSPEKRNIILINLHNRLDTVTKDVYDKDDIPF